MNQTRTFLMFALFAVGFLLWQAWEQDYGPHPVNQQTASATTAADGSTVPGATPTIAGGSTWRQHRAFGAFEVSGHPGHQEGSESRADPSAG
jgi:hypothetical protein